MNDETVRIYYKKWAASPTSHPSDTENFYKFVKAYLAVDRELNTEFLKLALYDSFHEKYSEEHYDKFKHKTVVLFEQLRDFANTNLP
jgi:hypothetical protein